MGNWKKVKQGRKTDRQTNKQTNKQTNQVTQTQLTATANKLKPVEKASSSQAEIQKFACASGRTDNTSPPVDDGAG